MLYWSAHCVISENIFQGNEGLDLFLLAFEYNRIYHNNFITTNIQDSTYFEWINYWDNGYPSGGNFWSDYRQRYPNAQEREHSGIWDTPYRIPTEAWDRYPLINPYNLSIFLVESYGPYHGVEKMPLQLNGSAFGGTPPYTSWIWDFGDGTTASGQDVQKTYDRPGVYKVNLTVTDSDHHIEYDTTTATITSHEVWVDDDFNESTPGWGSNHFNTIQQGIDMVTVYGIVHVNNGTYSNITVDKTLTLAGENRETTIIDGENRGTVVQIRGSADHMILTGFTIRNGGSGRFDAGIKIFSGALSVTIRNNLVRNNHCYGILFTQDTFNNIVSENTIQGNTYVDLYFYEFSSGNHLYHNNFLSTNVIDRSYNLNYWDDGYPSGGNYWSNYTGVDQYSGPNQDQLGSDGIGDTPYVFQDDLDHYPVMQPNGWVNQPPNKPTTPVGPTKGLINSNYSFITGATDPEDYLLYYSWEWGNGTISDWIGPYHSGEKVIVSHQWIEPGTYLVKVKAKDTRGSESIWSEVLPVIITKVFENHQ